MLQVVRHLTNVDGVLAGAANRDATIAIASEGSATSGSTCCTPGCARPSSLPAPHGGAHSLLDRDSRQYDVAESAQSVLTGCFRTRTSVRLGPRQMRHFSKSAFSILSIFAVRRSNSIGLLS